VLVHLRDAHGAPLDGREAMAKLANRLEQTPAAADEDPTDRHACCGRQGRARAPESAVGGHPAPVRCPWC
jgi:hypothetical protein